MQELRRIEAEVTGFHPKHPVVRDLCNGTWELMEPLFFDHPDGRSWMIPKGFVSDFGSIPTPLEWLPGLEPYGSEGDCPYLLHDYLFWCNRQGYPKCRNRKDADQILYDSMRLCGVGRLRASVIYWAVRAGGWRAWGKALQP